MAGDSPPYDVTKETSEKVDLQDQLETHGEDHLLKNGLEITNHDQAADEQKNEIKQLEDDVEPNQETLPEKNLQQSLNVDQTLPQCSPQNGKFSPENGKILSQNEQISPTSGKVSLLSGEFSSQVNKVSLGSSQASCQSNKFSPHEVLSQVEKVSPQCDKVSFQKSEVSPQTDKVSFESGEVSNQAEKVSPQKSEILPQTDRVSFESGEVSNQAEKVSPKKSEILPQSNEVSPQTGKVSPQLSPIVVRFSNCSDDMDSDLPVILNEDGDEDNEEGDDKENIFKEVGSDDSLTWDGADVEDDTDCVRSSARASSYLAPIQMKLRKACREGDLTALQKILNENPGIKLDLMDQDGSTCLNESVTKSCQFEDVTKLLLDAGAGVGVQDQLGNTPLHNSVLYYPATEETIQMLLDQGADTSIRNFDGATPISMADDKDLKKVMRLLSKSAAKSCGKNSGGLRQELAAKRRLCGNVAASPAEFKIVVEESPGTPSILKKKQSGKRKREEGGDDDEGEEIVKRRRIRFNEKEEAEVRLFSEDD